MAANWDSTGISLKFINELQNYCSANNSISKVILFGSRARGEYKKTSDIDLAVFTNNLNHSQQNLILNKITGMSTPLKLDILFFDRLSKEKLISNILRDGVIVYEQGAALRQA